MSRTKKKFPHTNDDSSSEYSPDPHHDSSSYDSSSEYSPDFHGYSSPDYSLDPHHESKYSSNDQQTSLREDSIKIDDEEYIDQAIDYATDLSLFYYAEREILKRKFKLGKINFSGPYNEAAYVRLIEITNDLRDRKITTSEFDKKLLNMELFEMPTVDLLLGNFKTIKLFLKSLLNKVKKLTTFSEEENNKLFLFSFALNAFVKDVVNMIDLITKQDFYGIVKSDRLDRGAIPFYSGYMKIMNLIKKKGGKTRTNKKQKRKKTKRNHHKTKK